MEKDGDLVSPSAPAERPLVREAIFSKGQVKRMLLVLPMLLLLFIYFFIFFFSYSVVCFPLFLKCVCHLFLCLYFLRVRFLFLCFSISCVVIYSVFCPVVVVALSRIRTSLHEVTSLLQLTQ